MRISANRASQLALVLLTGVGASLLASAQDSSYVRYGNGFYPPSSIEHPWDVGVRMHTNYILYAPSGSIVPATQPAGETPASLGCVYDLVSNQVAGCPVTGTTLNPTGG